jgi:hypothetical protein
VLSGLSRFSSKTRKPCGSTQYPKASQFVIVFLHRAGLSDDIDTWDNNRQESNKMEEVLKVLKLLRINFTSYIQAETEDTCYINCTVFGVLRNIPKFCDDKIFQRLSNLRTPLLF